MWVIGRGFAPSGKRLTVRGMSLCRLADGKIVEDSLNDNNSRELLFKELAASFSAAVNLEPSAGSRYNGAV